MLCLAVNLIKFVTDEFSVHIKRNVIPFSQMTYAPIGIVFG